MPGQREAAVRRHLAEHRHHVDLGRRRWWPCTCHRLPLSSAARFAGALRGLPRAAAGAYAALRHDAEVRQMAVDVGIDRRDLAERRLVQLLQDLELGASFGLQRAERLGKRGDDRRWPERIRGRFEMRLAEQVTDAAIERQSSSWQTFSTTRTMLPTSTDSSIDVEVDQRELRRVDLGEIGLLVGAAGRRAPRSACAAASRTRPSAAARSRSSTCRASRNICCSARASDLPARSISMSQTRSSSAVNESSRRWTVMSRQSPRIFASSRGMGRRAGATLVVTFWGTG